MINPKYTIVATLFNGKKIIVEPDFGLMKCHYRYLTQIEIDSESFDLRSKFIWLETPIYKTVEEGVTLIFSTVEATPIVLSRLT